MADQSHSAPRLCVTKKRLCDLFVDAIREATKLLDAHMEAVITNRKRLERFGIAIARALERCSRAESLYLLHVCEHGCGPLNKRDELPVFTQAASPSRPVTPRDWKQSF